MDCLTLFDGWGTANSDYAFYALCSLP